MKSKMQKFKLIKKTIVKSRKNDLKKVQQKRRKKRESDEPEIKSLSSRLWPQLGETVEEIAPADIKAFTDLPISKKTMEGMKSEKFIRPTDVQRESLLFALKGHDILGAAKTGSGKTLAFLIPILETLFRQRFTPSFGMAALVISPTRELAFQSFDVLKKIGKHHDLSFGLVTGGMLLKEEAKKMNSTNVVICTPGRLLQHFEQTPNFTADELKVLVLDEADKILHMGFADTMNAIVEALPKQRQTLLFSATQTKSVKDLARLSLKRPIYVSVHEKAKQTTPTSLDQRYIVAESQDKVNTLWSFMKSHKHKKILVFLSCCKEVRYLYQVFRKMQPGLTVLCLHGHMKQHQRMEVYNIYARKQHAVLLATDVAARGLDFPAVNWVVQIDKPENVDTYIHRVGRTARYESNGEALLVLLPSEEKKMVEELTKRKIPIVKLKVSKKRIFDVTKKLESLCAADKDLKNNAQKAFISVLKTLYILDKASFSTVDQDALATSLGLVQAPKLPFLEKANKKQEGKESSKSAENDDDDSGSDEDSSDDDAHKDSEEDESSAENDSEADSDSSQDGQEKKKKKATKKTDTSDEKKANANSKMTLNFSVDSDDEEDIYNVVKDVRSEDDEEDDVISTLVGVSTKKKSKAKERLKLLKYTTRITFDEEGNPEKEDDDNYEKGLDIPQALKRMREQDKLDKETDRQRVKQQHREKRLKEKEKRRQAELEKRGVEQTEKYEVVLGSPDKDDVKMDRRRDDNNDVGDTSEDESSDKGPQRKKPRLEENDLSEDGKHAEFANEDGDEDSEEEEMESEDEGQSGDEKMKGGNIEADEGQSGDEKMKGGNIEADEAAVLALLGGNR